MKEDQIKKKIEEIEKQIELCQINMVNAEYFDKLLEIHKKLWDFLYFKLNLEKTYLIK